MTVRQALEAIGAAVIALTCLWAFFVVALGSEPAPDSAVSIAPTYAERPHE